MRCARLVSAQSLVAVVLTITLFIAAHASNAASISSRLLIDPAGEHDGDTFGCSVASAGDVNAGGYDDLVIGANYYPSLSGQGRAYLFFGGPAIDAVADLAIPAPSGGTGWFGISVASAGDFNGDGYADVIVGARYAGGLPGKAFIYYGGPSPDATPDLTLIGETTGSSNWFGSSVAPDVFATAPGYYAGGTDPGAAYVWFGGPGFDTVADLTIRGSALSDRITAAANAGDVNADGFSDLLITRQDRAEVFFGGSTPNAELGYDTGRAYVYANSFATTAVPVTPASGLEFAGPRPNPGSARPRKPLLRSSLWIAERAHRTGDPLIQRVIEKRRDVACVPRTSRRK